MAKSPTIFVSYCQKHTKLKNFFVALLNDLGFRTEIFDYGSPASAIDTEKQLIEACDGFVALLTPDEEAADGRHICSMTVNQEIGMAYQAGKPFQLFAFDEVDFTAIQASQASTVAQFTTLSPSDADALVFDEAKIRQMFRALLESNAVVRITENSYSHFRFYIDFHPPIQAGIDLKYA